MTDLSIDINDIADFGGKSLVVTGGSSGIGLSITGLATLKGAAVFNGDLKPPKDSIQGVRFKHTDVTKWSDLVALFREAKDTFGSIDMVCVNAGVGRVPDVTFSDVFDDTGNLIEPTYPEFDVNLIGVCNTVKLAIHYMKNQAAGGSIVVTASMAGYSSIGLPIYAASKHGVIGLMRSLQSWIIPLRIRLNCIAPGITQSALTERHQHALAAVGILSQSADLPALAALYLHQQQDRNGRSIFCSKEKFRELESGVEAASEIIYGDNTAGRTYRSNPKQLEEVLKTVQTII